MWARGGCLKLLVPGRYTSAVRLEGPTFPYESNTRSKIPSFPARKSPLSVPKWYTKCTSAAQAGGDPPMVARSTDFRSCRGSSAKHFRKSAWQVALNLTRKLQNSNKLFSAGGCLCSGTFLRQSSSRASLRLTWCVLRLANTHGIAPSFRQTTLTPNFREKHKKRSALSYLNIRTFWTTPTSGRHRSQRHSMWHLTAETGRHRETSWETQEDKLGDTGRQAGRHR